MAREITQGATSQSVYMKILDSTLTTGAGKTGLTAATSNLTAAYTRAKSAAVAVTLVTLATVAAAYASGGFIEVDSTKCPGVYRLDVPDASVAVGAEMCIFHIAGSATGVAQTDLVVSLVIPNNQNATWGMDTSLGIVSRGTLAAGGSTIAFTLPSGQRTGVQVGDILKPDGIPAQIITAYNSGTGVGATAAFVSDPSSTAYVVFGSAPASSAQPVYISSGTGTGQLSVTSGVIQADVAKINGTTLTGNGTTTPMGAA